MTDRDPLEDELIGAFREARPPVSAPPSIGDLVDRRQAVVRRRVAGGMAIVVLAVGGVGVWAATSRSDPQASTASPSADTGASDSPTSGPYECSGPLGSDGTTWWFESCVAVPGEPLPVDPATTTTTSIVPMNTPTTTIARSPTSAAPAPEHTDPPVLRDDLGPTPTTVVVVTTSLNDVERSYTIQFGDFPRSVADMFCVTVESLLSYNDIAYELNADAGVSTAEFPAPGFTVKVPPGWSDDCPSVPTTAVTAPPSTTGP
ncbi:MAG: hypothetical protein AAGD33_22430 [Actinomycetota bacterium]